MDIATVYPPSTSLLADQFKKLFNARRRQLQDWEPGPPHLLGWIIFFFVSAELVLARFLFHETGLGAHALGQIIQTAFVILLLEGIMAKAGVEMAQYVQKSGSWKTTMTFFHLGLFPLLLFLPVTLLIWATGGGNALRVLFLLVLMLKVLSNWRESIEVTYEFTRLQSTFAVASVIGLIIFLFILFSYLSAIALVADLFEALQ